MASQIIARSRISAGALAALMALAAIAGCGSAARASGTPQQAMHPVPVSSARLRAALLTRFKLARTAPSTSNGHKGPPMSIVLAPTPANEAAARRNGAGDPLNKAVAVLLKPGGAAR